MKSIRPVLLVSSLLILLVGVYVNAAAQTPTNPAEVVKTAQWGDNVTITVDEMAGTFTFTSNGLPNHEILEAYVQKNANGTSFNSPQVTALNFTIPLNPTFSDTTTPTNAGAIGVAISGAVFFDPYEGGGDSNVLAVEDRFEVDGIPFVDACGGHPAIGGIMYHYHGVPYCITSVVDVAGQHSTLIGYLFDGFPVYGPQDVNGEPATDLDECNGHFGATPEFPEGIYHYHMTETAPYSIECYHGVVDLNSLRPAGGQGQMGQGGQPPQGGQGQPPQGGQGLPPNGNRPQPPNGAPPQRP